MTNITSSDWGTGPDGDAVQLYTLSNSQGMVAKITNHGGIITELHVPDKTGETADVVLGFDNLARYLEGHPHFGCITGRVANRIAHGKFTIDGVDYSVACNNPPHHLHGGPNGIDKRTWQAAINSDANGDSLVLTHHSPDGDQGFPGNMDFTVTYSLDDENGLRIDYLATTDQKTVVNLTNHSYFNLRGDNSLIHDYVLQLQADHYTPVDEGSIPTGEIAPVADTPFDFRTPRTVAARMGELENGYDHNFVLNDSSDSLTLAATLTDPVSGRKMETWTTEPAVQVYTANHFDGGPVGKYGFVYQSRNSICLETQHHPDAVNQPHFPSVLLNPGEAFRSTTVYCFSCV